MEPTIIAASEFKAKCLKILDQVAEGGGSVVVTKHGKPVAKLVPHESKLPPLEGSWRGHFKIIGDIVSSDWTDEDEEELFEEWDELTSQNPKA